MPTNNFKLFDENKTNILTDAEYAANTQRQNGVQTGVASSKLNNKFSYQTSLVAYAIAQIMNANGKDASDADAVATFVANLQGTLLQKVLDKATEAETIAGVINNKYITPATMKAAALMLAGGTMTGPLYLSRDPVDPLEAATKQWVEGEVEPKVGSFLNTFDSNPGDDWLLCNGQKVNASDYPDLANVMPDARREINTKNLFGSGGSNMVTSCYANGYLVVGGSIDGYTAGICYATTPSGPYKTIELWTGSSQNLDQNIVNKIQYANGYWVAVGSVSDGSGIHGVIAYTQSLTGAWTVIYPESDVGTSDVRALNSLYYGDGKWVAVGLRYYNYNLYGCFLYADSPTGPWTFRAFYSGTNTFQELSDVIYANNNWVLLRKTYPYIYYGEDITGSLTQKRMNSESSTTSNTIYTKIAYYNGTWVALGYTNSSSSIYGFVLYSTVLNTEWGEKNLYYSSNVRVRFNDIKRIGDYWVVTESTGTSSSIENDDCTQRLVYFKSFSESSAGISAFLIANNTNSYQAGHINSIEYIDGTYVAVGNILSNTSCIQYTTALPTEWSKTYWNIKILHGNGTVESIYTVNNVIVVCGCTGPVARIAYTTNPNLSWYYKDLYIGSTNDTKANCIVYENSTYVVGMKRSEGSKTNPYVYGSICYFTSFDGGVTIRDVFPNNSNSTINAIAYANGYWVVGGLYTNAQYAYSNALAGSWTNMTFALSSPGMGITSILYYKNKLLFGFDRNGLIYYADDVAGMSSPGSWYPIGRDNQDSISSLQIINDTLFICGNKSGSYYYNLATSAGASYSFGVIAYATEVGGTCKYVNVLEDKVNLGVVYYPKIYSVVYANGYWVAVGVGYQTVGINRSVCLYISWSDRLDSRWESKIVAIDYDSSNRLASIAFLNDSFAIGSNYSGNCYVSNPAVLELPNISTDMKVYIKAK